MDIDTKITSSHGSEKDLGKIQHILIIKVLEKAGPERIYFKIIKAICGKPIANPYGEKLEAIPLKSGSK